MGPGTLGITVADIPSDGQEQITRVNADITFNGYDHRWTVNGQATDIESIALHEIGHFIGFDHPCEDENETECLSPEERPWSPSYPGGLFQDWDRMMLTPLNIFIKLTLKQPARDPMVSMSLVLTIVNVFQFNL